MTRLKMINQATPWQNDLSFRLGILQASPDTKALR